MHMELEGSSYDCSGSPQRELHRASRELHRASRGLQSTCRGRPSVAGVARTHVHRCYDNRQPSHLSHNGTCESHLQTETRDSLADIVVGDPSRLLGANQVLPSLDALQTVEREVVIGGRWEDKGAAKRQANARPPTFLPNNREQASASIMGQPAQVGTARGRSTLHVQRPADVYSGSPPSTMDPEGGEAMRKQKASWRGGRSSWLGTA